MWAPVGDPIVFQRRWEPQRYVAVMGAASLESGLFYWESTYGAAMKADETKQFLRNLKAHTHKPRIVVFWDNAGIHKSSAVRLYAIELGIRLIMNAPYRPDLNGIEYIWANAKHHYRNRVAWHRANDVPYENTQLVDESLEQVPQHLAVSYIVRGMCALNTAVPILPTGFAKSREKQAEMMPRYDAFMRHPKYLKARQKGAPASGRTQVNEDGFKSTILKKDLEAHYRAWRLITGREEEDASGKVDAPAGDVE